MTDYSLVKKELAEILGCDESDTDKYELYINNAVSAVSALLISSDCENDVRIVNLCAARAYYQLALSDGDDIVSFTAGDVSYKRDTSPVSKAKALLELAIQSCGGLITGSGFAFKAV